MAKCDYCGTTILFGGVRDDDLRFCDEKCHQNGFALVLSRKISQDFVNEQAKVVHQGLCPKCKGNGPIDVHTSYRIYSLLLFTSWSSIPNICCRSCGIKSQISNCIFSFLFGWWGFPWGFLITPVQVVRNIAGILKGPDGANPSEKLNNLVRNLIAQQLIEKQQEPTTCHRHSADRLKMATADSRRYEPNSTFEHHQAGKIISG